MAEFNPTVVRVGFAVEKVALEQDMLLALRFSSATAIPPLLCINLLSRNGTVFHLRLKYPSPTEKRLLKELVASIYRIIIQKS
jgi:hypothetical protein